MDCCGSTKPKDTEQDIKSKPEEKKDMARLAGYEDHSSAKEQNQGGGCCGGSGSGMRLHLIIMFIIFVAFWYFGRR